MERENRKKENNIAEVNKRKWMSILGFLASIALLTIAIFLSINEENKGRLANLENYKSTQNLVQMANSELSKNVNEVKKANSENIMTNKTNNSITENNDSKNTTTIETAADANTNTTVETDIDTKTSSVEEYEEDNENENENNNNNNNNKQFIKPVDGEIIKEFSMDSLVYSDTLQEWVTHKGIDIKVNKEEKIKASNKGTVLAIKNDPRYGVSVIIQHEGGYETIYSCLLNSDNVKEGDIVEQGQVIGVAGNSGVFEVADGTHLHFEILKDGEYVNPELYIK